MLAPPLLAAEKLMQASFTFTPRATKGEEPDVAPEARVEEEPEEPEDRAEMAGPMASLLEQLREAGEPVSEPPVMYLVTYRGEQAPNPESRITLSSERDSLGVRRASLSWVLGESDSLSLWRATLLLAQELGRARIGRLASWEALATGGNHHMGTTRMSDDPRLGVVDRDCRVHGLENLWVAGSSVYPTSGSAGPTLTLVALALRLAERVEGALG